jgi:hypothetical protein
MNVEDAYVGPRTPAEAFPPACLRTHWDPTMVAAHILPSHYVAQPTDPRAAVRICSQYVTATPPAARGSVPLFDPRADLPSTPAAFLGGPHRPGSDAPAGGAMPPGGAAARGFPFVAYDPAHEADLLRMTEPLTRCSERRYLPQYASRETAVPVAHAPAASTEAESVPAFTNKAGCREADDHAAWARSPRAFMNMTRYDNAHGFRPSLQALPFPAWY